MKNTTKALGIVGIVGASFLPLKNYGQNIEKDSVMVETQKDNELSNENGKYICARGFVQYANKENIPEKPDNVIYQDFLDYIQGDGSNCNQGYYYHSPNFSRVIVPDDEKPGYIKIFYTKYDGEKLEVRMEVSGRSRFRNFIDFSVNGLDEIGYATLEGNIITKKMTQFSANGKAKFNDEYIDALKIIMQAEKYPGYY